MHYDLLGACYFNLDPLPIPQTFWRFGFDASIPLLHLAARAAVSPPTLHLHFVRRARARTAGGSVAERTRAAAKVGRWVGRRSSGRLLQSPAPPLQLASLPPPPPCRCRAGPLPSRAERDAAGGMCRARRAHLTRPRPVAARDSSGAGSDNSARRRRRSPLTCWFYPAVKFLQDPRLVHTKGRADRRISLLLLNVAKRAAASSVYNERRPRLSKANARKRRPAGSNG